MRVELIYSSDCSQYQSLRDNLETVIAEEALPIPVEMIEDNVTSKPPIIRIDGRTVESTVGTHTRDQLRTLLCQRWQELTEHSLNRA